MEEPQTLINGQSHTDLDDSDAGHLAASEPMAQATSASPETAEADRPTSDTNEIDAIREGKQKAQEVVAAANAGGSATSEAAGAETTANGPTNGVTPLSRKRSRDGTQLPLNQSASSTTTKEPSEDPKTRNERFLDRYIQRDLRYATIGLEQDRHRNELDILKHQQAKFYHEVVRPHRHQNPGSIFGYGYMGYGNGLTQGPNRFVPTAYHPPPKGRKTPQLRIGRKDTAQQAEMMEQLVPIRLDIELEKLRLRDTFTWNLQERTVSPALFTEYLLEDLRIPPEYAPEVARQVRYEIEDQTQNFYPHLIVEDGPLEPGRPYSEYKDDEMRIQIKLHITIGRIRLIDQFEWDINNPLNSPEEFARHMAWENALSGEFTTAIAHSIREQAHQYTKSLWLTNHVFDGRPIEDSEVREAFLPAPIYSSFRPQQAQRDWAPYMYEMSEAELDRTETIMMREHRAQKRQLNRRGGPALPDLRERQRTVRSLFVHSVVPGAVETWETTGILKTRRAGRAGRRPGARSADEELDSSELESEEDAPDSPLPMSSLNALVGTARTRNMRGAASAAQAAMRANYGRSTTPDSQQATPLDARASARRAQRDESVGDDGEQRRVVRLKINKARFRQWWEAYKAKKRASEYPLSGYASLPVAPIVQQITRQPLAATPKKDAGSGTPALTPRHLPGRDTRSRTPVVNGSTRGSRAATHDSLGRVEHDHWPTADDIPPAAPDWLEVGVQNLRDRHPDADFEPIMRPYCINDEDESVYRPNPPLDPGAPAPENTRVMYLPRLKCNDCPGKVYTTLPGRVEEDFEVHLKYRTHRERVAERVARKKRAR